MSEKEWTVKNYALFAENRQRAEDTLCGMANAVPDAVTDSWLQTAGFSALSGTRHGQQLVRELMRVTLTHVAAPIVAEQWLIKAELENQRDARTAPPESQVRPIAPSLPNVVPFFDEQLDVQALLAEVEKAQEHDRPCTGGEPQMIACLAHIIRTYRGMETRDSKVRPDQCGATHKTGLICSQKAWAHDEGFHYAHSQEGKLHRWAHVENKNARELGDSLFVQLDGGSGPFWALVKPHAVGSEEMTNDQSTWLALAAECDKRIDAGSVARWFRENSSQTLPKSIADAMPGFCRWVARKAATGVIESARKENDEAMRLIRFALNEAGHVIGKTPIVDMVRSSINENANIRRVLRDSGQMDVHPKDDVLDIIERLANGDAKERKQLSDIRQILTSAGFALANGLVASVRTLAERNDRDAADKLEQLKHVSNVRDQFDLELSEIRNVLSKAGHTVDTHEQLMGVLLALAGEDAPLDDGAPVETISGVWHSKYSRSYNRRLVELLSAYAYAGDADARDVMNALPMTHVRARIVAIIHAIETLAIAHGMNVADHLQ